MANVKNVPFHTVQTCKRSSVQMRSNAVQDGGFGHGAGTMKKAGMNG